MHLNLGAALHGVLPFMKARAWAFLEQHKVDSSAIWRMPDRAQMRQDMRKILQDYGRIPEKFLACATPRDWEIVWEYWSYVLDLIELADSFAIEPLFEHSGRRPDLVLWHRGHVYVIELKTTYPPMWTLGDGSAEFQRRMLHQVLGTRECLLEEPQAKSHTILVYVLLFQTGEVAPAAPTWLELGQL